MKKSRYNVDSDGEVPLFPEGWESKAKRVATANHGAVSSAALSLAASRRHLTVSSDLPRDSRRHFARASMACSAEMMLGQIKREALILGPAIEKLALPLNCCVKYLLCETE